MGRFPMNITAMFMLTTLRLIALFEEWPDNYCIPIVSAAASAISTLTTFLTPSVRVLDAQTTTQPSLTCRWRRINWCRRTGCTVYLPHSRLTHDSNSTKVIADHHGLVISGVKLGRGSRHIHNAAVQEIILCDTLQMRPKRLVNSENLLDGLRAIFPLYVGLALGFGRLVAVMLGRSRLERWVRS